MAARERSDVLRRYLAGASFATAAILSRLALDPLIGDRFPYAFSFVAIAAAACYGGAGPGLLSMLLGGMAAVFLWLPPRGVLALASADNAFNLGLYVLTGLVMVLIGEQYRKAHLRLSAAAREAARQREWLRVTLASIGDAVITTDVEARVTFLNPLAEKLSGWSASEVLDRPLNEIFKTINEKTRAPVDDPVMVVLRERDVVVLVDDTVLVRRDGTERPIEHSAAPIRDGDGSVIGVVLIFREVSERRRAERALAESEARYRLLAEGCDQLVWTRLPDGRIDYLNRHWCEYTGLSPEQTDRGGWASVVHEDDRAGVVALWQRHSRTGEGYEVEYRLRHAPDGAYRWHLARVQPLRDEQERVVKWLGMALDIEDRKRAIESLRTSEERLRLALEAGRMGTWDWDLDAGSLTWSPGLEAVHGLAPGTFPGTPEAAPQYIHPDDRAWVRESVRNSLDLNEEHQIEHRVVWPDGSVHWIEGRGKPLIDGSGRVYRMIGMGMDITERKRAEAELRKALDLAEEASRAKDQFLAMLSHELRTPLTPVLLAASEMLADPATAAAHREALNVIRQNVELEVRLIDDLLDVMRIIRGKLPYHFEVVDVHDLLRRTLDICRGEIEDKQIGVCLEDEAVRHHVRGDSARLQQVLWNLIKNAVKFTPGEGKIRVRTSHRDEARLVVEVNDSGVGIEPASLRRIFTAFEQEEDAATGRFGGLGLGLAISKAIIEAHGGELSASSAGKGCGATFRFTLATVAATATDDTPESTDDGASGDVNGLRVLLVEDDPMTARIMARLLRQNGYLVATAGSLAGARAIPPEEIDMVVSDIGLPDGSGCDLMRWIAERHGVPGIALTGFGREDDIQRCLDAGFVAHLTKPVDFARLDAMIRQVAAEFSQRPQTTAPARS